MPSQSRGRLAGYGGLIRVCVVIGALVLVAAGCGTASTAPPGGGSASASGSGPASPTSSSSSAPAATGLASSTLADLSWVSATEGWALASHPCPAGSCARLAHTTDGGAHWQALPDPPAQLQDENTDCATRKCVSGVRFASPAIGYLYGPALLLTTDGGRTWHPEPGPSVETLTVAGGQVYRVAYDSSGCPGPCQPTLQAAVAGSTTWRTLIGQLAEPGRSNTAQIVASGSSLLVAMYGSEAGPVSAQAIVYRSADDGATWQQRTDPCTGRGAGGQEEDLIDLAAAPGGFFAGLCSPHSGTAAFAVTSGDGGESWRQLGALPGIPALDLLAAASPATLAVSTGVMYGGGGYTARLLVTTDGGQHWSAAASDTQRLSQGVTPAWLGFGTSRAGWWIGDPHSIWTTGDGGAHWTQVAFR